MCRTTRFAMLSYHRLIRNFGDSVPQLMNKKLLPLFVVFLLSPVSTHAAPSNIFIELLKELQIQRAGTAAQAPMQPTVDLTVDRSVITSGEAFTLTWSSSGSTSCEAQGGWTGDLEIAGSSTLQSYGIGERIFSVQCTGDGGDVSSLPITVRFMISPEQRSTQAAIAAMLSTI